MATGSEIAVYKEYLNKFRPSISCYLKQLINYGEELFITKDGVIKLVQ